MPSDFHLEQEEHAQLLVTVLIKIRLSVEFVLSSNLLMWYLLIIIVICATHYASLSSTPKLVAVLRGRRSER